MIDDLETTSTAIKYKGQVIYTSRNFVVLDAKDFGSYMSIVIQNPTHTTVATFEKLSLRLIHTRKGNGIVSIARNEIARNEIDHNDTPSLDITSYGRFSLITDRLDLGTGRQKIVRHHVVRYPILNATQQDNDNIVLMTKTDDPTKYAYYVLDKASETMYVTMMPSGDNIQQTYYFEIIENNLFIRTTPPPKQHEPNT